MEVVGPGGAVMVAGGGGGGDVNVPPTVTAVVLAAGVVGGLFTVLAVLVCCRYCCSADARRPGTTLVRKRFVPPRTKTLIERGSKSNRPRHQSRPRAMDSAAVAGLGRGTPHSSPR